MVNFFIWCAVICILVGVITLALLIKYKSDSVKIAPYLGICGTVMATGLFFLTLGCIFNKDIGYVKTTDGTTYTTNQASMPASFSAVTITNLDGDFSVISRDVGKKIIRHEEIDEYIANCDMP